MSFDKASDACKIERQQELEVTKLDYELKAPSPGYPFSSLNKTVEELFRILLKDALNSHWIQLYNSTIWKNLVLFMNFYNTAKNTEFQTVGDFTRTYNFFVRNRFNGVRMVRIIPRPLLCYFVWKWYFRLLYNSTLTLLSLAHVWVECVHNEGGFIYRNDIRASSGDNAKTTKGVARFLKTRCHRPTRSYFHIF